MHSIPNEMNVLKRDKRKLRAKLEITQLEREEFMKLSPRMQNSFKNNCLIRLKSWQDTVKCGTKLRLVTIGSIDTGY